MSGYFPSNKELAEFYSEVYDKGEYSDIANICPGISSKNCDIYAILLISILQKKTTLESYIIPLLRILRDTFEVDFDSFMIDSVVYARLTHHKIYKSVKKTAIEASEKIRNAVVQEYNQNNIINIIKRDDAPAFLYLARCDRSFDYYKTIYVPDSIIYKPFLENEDYHLSLRSVCAFYGAINVYRVVKESCPYREKCEIACMIIGDNREFFNKYRDKILEYPKLKELLIYAHCYNLLTERIEVNRAELYVYSLLHLNFSILYRLDATIRPDENFTKKVADVCQVLRAEHITSQVDDSLARVFVGHCGDDDLRARYAISYVSKHWKYKPEEPDFVGKNHFNCIELKDKKTEKLISEMFDELYILFEVFGTISMRDAFYGCDLIECVEFPNDFEAKYVTDMYRLFYDCKSLKKVVFPTEFDVSNVTDMSFMFSGCEKLQEIVFPEVFDTSNVKNMSFMFSGCQSLPNIRFLSKFNTKNVTNMGSMFCRCTSVRNVKLQESFDTSNVTNMRFMFCGMKSLEDLVLSPSFSTSNVTDMESMFFQCPRLQRISFPENFDARGVRFYSDIFKGCSSLRRVAFPASISTKRIQRIVDLLPQEAIVVYDDHSARANEEDEKDEVRWDAENYKDTEKSRGREKEKGKEKDKERDKERGGEKEKKKKKKSKCMI